jgi:hypothetical protein
MADHQLIASSETFAETWQLLTGQLVPGYRLREPVEIHVWREGEEYVAAAENLEIHAFGSDRDQAISNLRVRIVEQTLRLRKMREQLSASMVELSVRLDSLVMSQDA